VKSNKIKFRSYEKAREWARQSGIKSPEEWFRAYDQGRIPLDIPKYPGFVYSYEPNSKGFKRMAKFSSA